MSSRPHLLVHGYIRTHEVLATIQLPDAMKQLIYMFFPQRCVVFGIGTNEFCELGNYKESMPITSRKMYPMTHFNKLNFNAQDIYYGYYRFTIKTHQHRVYSIGNNSCGDCAVGTIENVMKQFTEIDMKNIENNEANNNYVSCISNGGNHMIMVINNVVYANGNNTRGQLGCSQSDQYQKQSPTNINFPFSINQTKIIQAECGYSHTIFLDDNGKLFGCGANDKYQLGLNMASDKVRSVTPIDCDANIQRIDCGAHHNLCISKENELFVFGRNKYGSFECGFFDETGKISIPTIHPYFKQRNMKIIFIATKDYHSLCIDSNHKLYLFGNNDSCQISKQLANIKQIIEFAIEYPQFKHYSLVQGSCGLDHTILLTKNNTVIGFGGNGKHQTKPCANTQTTKEPHVFSAEEIGLREGQKVLRVMATDRTTLIICEDL